MAAPAVRKSALIGAMVPPPAVAGYRVAEKLGAGGQGAVFAAVHESTGRPAAIKFIDVSLLDEARRRQVDTEVRALSALSGAPYVIQLFTFVPAVTVDEVPAAGFAPAALAPAGFGGAAPGSRRRTYLVLVLEKCHGESFFAFLKAGPTMSTAGQPFPEPLARVYIQQLVAAVERCHLTGIAHRDLKFDNMLVDEGYGLKVRMCACACVSARARAMALP